MIRLKVRVKPRSSRNAVAMKPDGSLVVRVTAPAAEGRANESLIEILADHFHKPKRSIQIRFGVHSKDKVVEID
jgi:hypothetical protein